MRPRSPTTPSAPGACATRSPGLDAAAVGFAVFPSVLVTLSSQVKPLHAVPAWVAERIRADVPALLAQHPRSR